MSKYRSRSVQAVVVLYIIESFCRRIIQFDVMIMNGVAGWAKNRSIKPFTKKNGTVQVTDQQNETVLKICSTIITDVVAKSRGLGLLNKSSFESNLIR